MTALEQRHIVQFPNGDYELVAVKDNNGAEEVCRWCDTLGKILLDATIRLYGVLGLRRVGPCEEDLQAFDAHADELFGPDRPR